MKKLNIYQVISVLLVITVVILAMQIRKPQEIKDMKKETTLAVIHERKSVRKFIDRVVSKEDLLTLVKAGMAAPSGKNEQPWAFVVVTERATLDAMAENLPHAKMLKQASAAIAVCGDMSKVNDPAASLWVQDCAAATENILLAAEAMDLGAVWTAAYPYEDRMRAVTNALGLPETCLPLCVIPIGYPEGTELPKDKWKEENVRWEKW